MEGFTIVDGIVVIVIVLSALLAYGRGLVREAMAIAGWVGAAILAFLFAPKVQPLISESRSAQVFGQFTGQIEEQNPEAALGWITRQYEQLTNVCTQ